MSDTPVIFPENSVWWYIDEALSDAYTRELRKEVHSIHVLVPELEHLKVIAKCDANDDVLVAHAADPDRFYIVHLTWTRKPDRKPEHFPMTNAIKRADLQAFFDNY